MPLAWRTRSGLPNTREVEFAVLFRLWRWGDIVTCPYCGSIDVEQKGLLKSKLGPYPFYRYRCRTCGSWFSDLTGTPFEKSTLPLSVLAEMAEYTEMGIGAEKIAELLGISKRTVSKWLKIFREEPFWKELLLKFTELIEE